MLQKSLASFSSVRYERIWIRQPLPMKWTARDGRTWPAPPASHVRMHWQVGQTLDDSCCVVAEGSTLTCSLKLKPLFPDKNRLHQSGCNFPASQNWFQNIVFYLGPTTTPGPDWPRDSRGRLCGGTFRHVTRCGLQGLTAPSDLFICGPHLSLCGKFVNYSSLELEWRICKRNCLNKET